MQSLTWDKGVKGVKCRTETKRSSLEETRLEGVEGHRVILLESLEEGQEKRKRKGKLLLHGT